MKTSEVLYKAADLVAQGWTQHYEARDPWGEPTAPEHWAAVRWCAYGAVRYAAQCSLLLSKNESRLNAVAYIAAFIPNNQSLAAWNDHPDRTQDEVVDLLRRAADQAKAKEEGEP